MFCIQNITSGDLKERDKFVKACVERKNNFKGNVKGIV
jgi:hypothetical protein